MAPFDLFGGWILPRRFRRSQASLGRFMLGWLRGVAVQGMVVGAIAWTILSAGRLGGLPAAIVAFGAAMLALLAAQETLARLLARLTVVQEEHDVSLLRANDDGFTGGIVGLPGRERFLVPDRWIRLLRTDGLTVQMTRWSSMISTGRRTAGIGVALLWNLSGFALASLLTAANVQTVSGLTTIALAFTLWSFVGLLFLPTLSRPAVFAADRAASDRVGDERILHETLATLDRQQDDEPRRRPGIETIFHPIPALSRRVAALSDPAAPASGAWHAARTALYLSWAGFGLLSRAVHCNSGRPELWVLLPCD
jgi:Zn-dependent protease with chaperone function